MASPKVSLISTGWACRSGGWWGDWAPSTEAPAPHWSLTCTDTQSNARTHTHAATQTQSSTDSHTCSLKDTQANARTHSHMSPAGELSLSQDSLGPLTGQGVAEYLPHRPSPLLGLVAPVDLPHPGKKNKRI